MHNNLRETIGQVYVYASILFYESKENKHLCISIVFCFFVRIGISIVGVHLDLHKASEANLVCA